MDMNRFKQRTAAQIERQKNRSTGDNNRVPRFDLKAEGRYGLYFPPPTVLMDSNIFVEIAIHWWDSKPYACLALENEILWSPALQNALAALKDPRSVSPGDGCPICELLEDPDNGLSDVDKNKAEIEPQFMCNLVPIWMGDIDKADDRRSYPSNEQVVHYWPGKSSIVNGTSKGQWRGISSLIAKLSRNPTDPEKPILFVVSAKGKGFPGPNNKNPRTYSVDYDVETIEQVYKLPKWVRAEVANIADGSKYDIFERLAGMSVRSRAEVEAAIYGEPETKRTDGDGQPPACFQKSQCDPADDYCRACKFKVACAESDGVDVPLDIGAEPEKPKVAAKPATRPAPARPAAPAKPAPAPAARRPAPQPAPEPEPEPLAEPDPDDELPSEDEPLAPEDGDEFDQRAEAGDGLADEARLAAQEEEPEVEEEPEPAPVPQRPTRPQMPQRPASAPQRPTAPSRPVAAAAPAPSRPVPAKPVAKSTAPVTAAKPGTPARPAAPAKPAPPVTSGDDEFERELEAQLANIGKK